MKNIVRAACAVWVAVLAMGRCAGEEVLPVLKTGSQTFTNVTVVSVTDTHLFFRAGGVEDSVKLKDLDPQLQKEFGYEPRAEMQVAELNVQPAAETRPAAFSKKSTFNEVVPHDFRLSDGTKLRLTYPKFWTRTSDSATGDLPVIRLKHPYPDNFQVLVALMPKNNPFAKFDTHQAVEIHGNHILRMAVETNLVVSAIEGPEVKGHYFGLTLKNPRNVAPAECQGLVKLADMQICFSVLCDDWKSFDVQAAVEMMRTAQLISKSTEKKNENVP